MAKVKRILVWIMAAIVVSSAGVLAQDESEGFQLIHKGFGLLLHKEM